MNSQNHTNSDLVWARMKYCPFWPARVIEQAPPIVGRIPANKICVFFFGTKNYGLVDLDKVLFYTEHREKYISKGRGPDFVNAVKSLEEFMSDRTKYQSNAQPTLMGDQIQVKQEHDIEQNLGIKSEKKSPKGSSAMSKKSASVPIDSSAWLKEKKTLVAKIVGLQTENQRITFDLQNKTSQWEAIIQEKVDMEQQLSEKVHTLTQELKTAHSEAAIINSNFNEQKNRDNETITQLTYENKTLNARIMQLQVGINQQKESTADSEPNENMDDVYYVEKLIRHRKTKNGMEYLVRWQNYTSKDDTWEMEENLMCPEILESYKQKMKL